MLLLVPERPNQSVYGGHYQPTDNAEQCAASVGRVARGIADHLFSNAYFLDLFAATGGVTVRLSEECECHTSEMTCKPHRVTQTLNSASDVHKRSAHPRAFPLHQHADCTCTPECQQAAHPTNMQTAPSSCRTKEMPLKPRKQHKSGHLGACTHAHGHTHQCASHQPCHHCVACMHRGLCYLHRHSCLFKKP